MGFEPTPFRTRTLIWRLRPTRPSQHLMLSFPKVTSNYYVRNMLRVQSSTMPYFCSGPTKARHDISDRYLYVPYYKAPLSKKKDTTGSDFSMPLPNYCILQTLGRKYIPSLAEKKEEEKAKFCLGETKIQVQTVLNGLLQSCWALFQPNQLWPNV